MKPLLHECWTSSYTDSCLGPLKGSKWCVLRVERDHEGYRACCHSHGPCFSEGQVVQHDVHAFKTCHLLIHRFVPYCCVCPTFDCCDRFGWTEPSGTGVRDVLPFLSSILYCFLCLVARDVLGTQHVVEVLNLPVLVDVESYVILLLVFYPLGHGVGFMSVAFSLLACIYG